jgi:hypothetical protein
MDKKEYDSETANINDPLCKMMASTICATWGIKATLNPNKYKVDLKTPQGGIDVERKYGWPHILFSYPTIDFPDRRLESFWNITADPSCANPEMRTDPEKRFFWMFNLFLTGLAIAEDTAFITAAREGRISPKNSKVKRNGQFIWITHNYINLNPDTEVKFYTIDPGIRKMVLLEAGRADLLDTSKSKEEVMSYEDEIIRDNPGFGIRNFGIDF